jgi:site-specific DNA-methyltransferase (adenine-specific)
MDQDTQITGSTASTIELEREAASIAAKCQVQWVPLDSVHLNPENPRLNDPAVQPVMQSIARFGFRVPIVVNRRTNLIEAGNTRWKAAQRMGLTEVPVIFADDDEVTALAFALADNRTAEIATWDEPSLADLLQRLEAAGELQASGFSDDDLGSLLARLDAEEKSGREETFDADQAMAEAEQQQGPTRVQPGELWQLGRHHLLCGDATDPANWERLMADETAHAIITDPPYAINYLGGRAAQEERIGAKRRGGEGQEGDAYWDDLSDDEYRHLLMESLSLAHQHSDDKAPLYLWFASSHLRDVLDCMRECGWQERNLLVWVKNNGAGALFAQYKHWYEPCFYAFKRGQAPRWHGPTNERTVWEHDKPVVNDLHPTMKPLALIERSIANATELGQLVVDPFLGSGTAIIAAERTGRKCYGFDLDVRYCDVIVSRWESFTGEEGVKCNG